MVGFKCVRVRVDIFDLLTTRHGYTHGFNEDLKKGNYILCSILGLLQEMN